MNVTFQQVFITLLSLKYLPTAINCMRVIGTDQSYDNTLDIKRQSVAKNYKQT